MNITLLIGSIVIGVILFVIVIFGIYALTKYETGSSNSKDLPTLITFYWEKFNSWKDSVLAFIAILIFLLIYISFQLSILNFYGFKSG
jgi:purine-cytosine permease-like protein